MQKLIIILFSILSLNASSITSDFPNSLVTNNIVKSGIFQAWYDGATSRYSHGVLGDDIEASILKVSIKDKNKVYTSKLVLDKTLVFEDLKPRLFDIDKDGNLEVIVIQSHEDLGARVAIYKVNNANKLVLFESTFFIGTRYRWLAIAGIADFNDDGFIDIAYVDRPHLAKVLRIYTFKDNDFFELDSIRGLSNHRIGEDFISGGIRNCNNKIEIITANSNWDYIMSTSYFGNKLQSQQIAKYKNNSDFNKILLCK